MLFILLTAALHHGSALIVLFFLGGGNFEDALQSLAICLCSFHMVKQVAHTCLENIPLRHDPFDSGTCHSDRT